MITAANIYKAIKIRLEFFFSDIKLQIKDIKTINPPCVYIELANSNRKEIANETFEATYGFNIVYFSKDETLKDLIQKQNIINKAFKKPLKVVYYSNFNEELSPYIKYLDITSLSFELDETNYILSCGLNFNFIEPQEIYTNNEKLEENKTPYENEALSNKEYMTQIEYSRKNK